jgi:lysophospholipase L1-like esterase
MFLDKISDLEARFMRGERTRIVAFGSSNTDRRIHGLHWFDWLDLGIKQTYGRVAHSINAGTGGDTTRDLLRRWETDVALYRPHAVLVTIGGNDANPEKDLGADEYRANLHILVQRIRDLGAVPILQTYYAADLAGLGEPHASSFQRNMQIIREVASAEGCELVDHHIRWERVRLQHPQVFAGLMIDALHTNPLGNATMGLDLIRKFGVHLDPDQQAFTAAARGIQALMDALAS